MGCGGSTNSNPDGSLKPGTGEVKLAPEFETPILWYWGGGEGKKAVIQLKEIPTDPKLLKDAKWEEKGSGPLGIQQVIMKPCMAQQRWQLEMEGGPVNMLYPGYVVPDLCKKIHAAHKKDEEKYPKLMKKAAEKKEGHVYNNNPDKAKTDCDALSNCVNPTQMSDDMVVLKDSLMTLEDALPGNNAGGLSASVKHAYGIWKEDMEKPPELSLQEKGLKMKDEQLQNPANLTKVVETKEKVLNEVVKGVVMGMCKALELTQEELIPNLDALVAAANGKKPLSEANYDKLAKYNAKMEGKEKPKPEQVEEERKKVVKSLLEEDKKVEAEKKKLDQDTGALIQAANDKITKAVEYAKEACKPADPSALKTGARVLAQWKNFGYYEGVLKSDVKEGVISQNPDGTKVEGKYCEVAFDDGDTDSVPIANIALEKTEAIPEDDVIPGARVRCKFFGDVWMDATVVAKASDGTWSVKYDLVFTESGIKASEMRPCHDLSSLSTCGTLLPRSFYDVSFQWLQPETDLDITLRLWREGDEGNVETHKLNAFQKKKVSEDGADGGHIHGGYKAVVPIWNRRAYCYNFKIGDEFFVDFKKPVAEKGFKSFTLEVSA